jgi:hypothetical protein
MSQLPLFFGKYTVLHPTFRLNVFMREAQEKIFSLDIADGDSFTLKQGQSTDPIGHVLILYGQKEYLVSMKDIQVVVATELIVADLVHPQEDRVPAHLPVEHSGH